MCLSLLENDQLTILSSQCSIFLLLTLVLPQLDISQKHSFVAGDLKYNLRFLEPIYCICLISVLKWIYAVLIGISKILNIRMDQVLSIHICPAMKLASNL